MAASHEPTTLVRTIIFYNRQDLATMGMHGQKIDVIASILESSLNGTQSAKLRTKTSLRPKLFEEYLNLLLSKNLISLSPYQEKKRKGMIVTTTERGKVFLELHRSMKMKYLTQLQ